MTEPSKTAREVLADAYAKAGQKSCGRYISAGNELVPDQPIWLAAMEQYASMKVAERDAEIEQLKAELASRPQWAGGQSPLVVKSSFASGSAIRARGSERDGI